MKKASIFCNEIALSLTIKISFNYTSGYLRAKIFKIFKLYIYSIYEYPRKRTHIRKYFDTLIRERNVYGLASPTIGKNHMTLLLQIQHSKTKSKTKKGEIKVKNQCNNNAILAR